MEKQAKTELMEKNAKNESCSIGHDKYKQRKMQYKKDTNQFISQILKRDPYAFDSSTHAIMRLLSMHPDIQLSDVLGKYILTTSTSNNSVINYVPNIAYIFNHFFEYSNESMIINGINFSSYNEFLITRNKKIYDKSYVTEGFTPYDD